jgi:Flp pilus assembly pilin Flp
MKAANRATNLPLLLKFWAEDLRAKTTGQDLIEYALMAAFLAVACAALMPALATNVSRIYTVVASVLFNAKSTGS